MTEELERGSVPAEMTWDVTKLYKTEEDWEADCTAASRNAEALAEKSGKLGDSKTNVLSALNLYMEMNRRLERIYNYAMMRMHEDTSNGHTQSLLDRAATLYSACGASSAFLTPELLSLPEETLKSYIADPDFAEYDVFLDDMLRLKPHVLGPAEERLLAMAGEVTGVPGNASELLMGADLRLGQVSGEDGKKERLTDANYMGYLTSPNRNVRRHAWQTMMRGYDKMGNTFAALYAGQVKADIFYAHARGYESCREAALYPDRIDGQVYDSLIEAVHGGIDTLDVYLDTKRTALGLSRLHHYDLYAELPTKFSVKPDIQEAFGIFLKAVEPLGRDYVEDASRALKDRWIDVYPTKNKRSGAYSTSVYGVTPYVMLNHKPDYDGLSTLCHEMGHAMHSFYSAKNQPFAKAEYTIFVAEVASTTNEILLNEYLRKVYADDREAQIALIGNLLEHFRTTVFRQTLFAEFEMKAHAMAEAGESLTKESLSALHADLNKTYYGNSCVQDKEIASEWMRIPHFYSPFYVYKYATGFCAAAALARNVLSGEPAKVSAYRKFLTLGGSLPPIEELKVAGVDMSGPVPVCEALDYFAELLMQYRSLVLKEEA